MVKRSAGDTARWETDRARTSLSIKTKWCHRLMETTICSTHLHTSPGAQRARRARHMSRCAEQWSQSQTRKASNIWSHNVSMWAVDDLWLHWRGRMFLHQRRARWRMMDSQELTDLRAEIMLSLWTSQMCEAENSGGAREGRVQSFSACSSALRNLIKNRSKQSLAVKNTDFHMFQPMQRCSSHLDRVSHADLIFTKDSPF